MSRLSRAWDALTGKAPAGQQAAIIAGVRNNLPRRGTDEILRAYSASPMLQAVARKIAGAVASTPWYAATTSEDGEEIRLPGHVAAEMLNSGTDGLSGFQARSVMALHHLLVGEAFALIQRHGLTRVPVARWPIPPHWVAHTPMPGREWFDVTFPNGGIQRFEARDVIWIKQPDPFDPYGRGVGSGAALDDELAADEFAAKHLAASLKNRARPDLIISGGDGEGAALRDEDVRRIEEVWGQRFGGPQRAARPFFSRAPLNVHDLTPTFRELDLTNLRAYERDIIVSVFGVPPELVGILQNSNRATIESAEFLFTKHVVKPMLVAERSVLQDTLAPQYDERLLIRFEDPVDEDIEARRTWATANRDMLTVDEHRALIGLPPLPDGAGDVFPLSFTSSYREAHGEAAPASPAPPAQELGARIKAPDDAWNIDPAFFAELLERAYREAGQDIGSAALAELGIEVSFTIERPDVLNFLRQQAAERSRLIVGTTREALRATLTEGVGLGENTDSLVARIMATVRDAGAVRANTIARTEIVQASNYATTEAHRQAGIERREWLSVQDSRTRDEHAALDGMQAGIDQPFEVGGRTAMYPGGFGVAELDINCRCGVLPVIPAGIAGEKRAAIWKGLEARRGRHEQRLEGDLIARFARLAEQQVAALRR